MNEESTAPVENAEIADTDAQEWESIMADFAAENGVTKQEDETPKAPEQPVEPAKTDEPPKTDEAPKPQQEEQQHQPQYNNAIRDQRALQREIEADQRAMHDDIRSQMFNDTKTQLVDADGDPIRSIEDVQKLINPNTGAAFTEEEAAMWLLAAQQQLSRNIESIDRQIEQIAETNLSLKDGADAVRDKYGALLQANPELREAIWKQYEATLERDPKTDIIVKAPVSIEAFYDVTLKGYSQLAAQMQANVQQQEQHQKETARLTRSDRSDVYGGNGGSDLSGDDKEWAEAAKAVFS